jgi:transcriptional regulator GlxA family with amidase domain
MHIAHRLRQLRSRPASVQTQVSPHAYIVLARLDEAKRLMRQTAEPLCAIAATCGLADQAHLSRLFRRTEGMTAAAWRRSAKRQDPAAAGPVRLPSHSQTELGAFQ